MQEIENEISLYEAVLVRQGIEFAVFNGALQLEKASRALRERFPKHSSLFEVVPELTGMEEAILTSWRQGEEIVILRLNRSREGKTHYVDLQLVPFGEQLLLIFKDNTFFGELEQKLVQQRNELALLNRELEKSYRKLGGLSGIDDVTQLFNRTAAREFFQRRLAIAQKHGQPVSLIFLDMDNLKEINDRYGHESGDSALRLLANVLRNIVRAGDAPARWGGDEFVILLNDDDGEGARRIARTLFERLTNTPCILSDGTQKTIQVSIGICHAPAHALSTASLEKILQAADRAMYISKHSGGNRITEVNLE
ncbi:MAG: diguanylate cyclase [Anaerolineales bacterium]